MELKGAPLATPLPDWIEHVEPDKDGTAATAWKVTRPGDPDDPRWAVSLPGWLVLAPWAHLAWDWHIVFCVSLDVVEGAPPPSLRYPGAQWDLMCVALDPRTPAPHPQEAGEDFEFLVPLDASVQFHNVPEGAAGVERLLDVVVTAVCEGRLVPDSDYASVWEQAIQTTLMHVRTGRHGL